jgi:hypothetical protein
MQIRFATVVIAAILLNHPARATLTLAKGDRSFAELNSTFLLRDADICVATTFPDASKVAKLADGSPSGSQAGIVFAAKDYDNFYLFTVGTSGRFHLSRKAGTIWTYPIDWTASPAVKPGPGNTATLIVNDQTDKRFGFYAQVDNPTPDGGTPFVFKNFVVNQPK